MFRGGRHTAARMGRSFSKGRGHHYRGRGGGGRGRGGRGRGPPQSAGDGPHAKVEEFGKPSDKSVAIAVEGCCHGEIEAIYNRLQQHEKIMGRSIDLLICCGDFQSLRNFADFHSFAVPPKYRSLGSFHEYYAGTKLAPILTLFIGGNHEASQPLQELCYGGWVAPNIYYMGASSVVQFQGLRIGGISGIYAPHNYQKGSFERPPYPRNTIKSVYHTRNVPVYRMESMAGGSKPLDIMISHDWPRGIEQHGNTDALISKKKHFRAEIARNDLGSPSNERLLSILKPKWWFSAHLHVKFLATVHHSETTEGSLVRNQGKTSKDELVPSQVLQQNELSKKGEDEREEPTTTFVSPETEGCSSVDDLTDQMTRFLSLDKCLPRRHYISILHVDVPGDKKEDNKIEYDTEWLAVLKKTHELTKTTPDPVVVPEERATATEEEVQWIRDRFDGEMEIPLSAFEQTVPPHTGSTRVPHQDRLPPPYPLMGNPQTDRLLQKLELAHITTVPYVRAGEDDNEIDLDDEDGDAEEMDDNEIDIEDEEDEESVSKRPKIR